MKKHPIQSNYKQRLLNFWKLLLSHLGKRVNMLLVCLPNKCSSFSSYLIYLGSVLCTVQESSAIHTWMLLWKWSHVRSIINVYNHRQLLVLPFVWVSSPMLFFYLPTEFLSRQRKPTLATCLAVWMEEWCWMSYWESQGEK